MLIAIDAGNSTIAFGIYPEPAKREPLHVAKVAMEPPPTAAQCEKVLGRLLHLAETGDHADRSRVSAPGNRRVTDLNVIISSVVPRLNRTLIATARSVSPHRPLVVSHRTTAGLRFEVPKPAQVGSDRIANAVAASSAFKGPVAVADCGTATTITVVGPRGQFLGGAIMPGLSLMTDSLHRSAARLPRVPLAEPRDVLGRETAASIASGVINGTAGAIEFILRGIEKELGFRVQLVLTGGHCGLLSPVMGRRHRVMPSLTFEGLRLIYLRNAHPVS
jgi:type III pantothenate kinase